MVGFMIYLKETLLQLFNLFGLIPWDPPSFLIIGAWPVAMGISMWIQQKLNPKPPDPIQAKIFMLSFLSS